MCWVDFWPRVEAHPGWWTRIGRRKPSNAVMDGLSLMKDQTSRPVSAWTWPDDSCHGIRTFFPRCRQKHWLRILEGLERNRIIRIENESIELAAWQPGWRNWQKEICRSAAQARSHQPFAQQFIEYQKSGQHLNEKQLESILQVAGSLSLDPAMASFIEASRFHNLKWPRSKKNGWPKNRRWSRKKWPPGNSGTWSGDGHVLILGALPPFSQTNQRKAEQAGIIAKARQLGGFIAGWLPKNRDCRHPDAWFNQDILNSIDEITAGLVGKVQSEECPASNCKRCNKHSINTEPAPKPRAGTDG